MGERFTRKRFTAWAVAAVMGAATISAGVQPLVTAQAAKAAKTYHIAVIVKATDSDFWQSLIKGAMKAQAALHGEVKITTYGPPSEADIAQQVSILENVISTRPDGIVLASTSSDATVPALQTAAKKQIPVVLCDNRVHTDKYLSFLATNNLKAGALAADQLVAALKSALKPLKGQVGLISAMAGVQVLIDRDNGFKKELHKIAPGIQVLPTRYVNNDIPSAMGAAEDTLTKNPKLLGFFADNNHTGDGVAQAVSERHLAGKVPVVAFDSDPTEVNDLKSGAISALIVQDPWLMGYQGVMTVVDYLHGKRNIPREVDTGATAVTKANFKQPRIQALLDPSKRQKP